MGYSIIYEVGRAIEELEQDIAQTLVLFTNEGKKYEIKELLEKLELLKALKEIK